jgi:glycine/D-amino acid oxidase-like deaminating enzyme/nitrite reductase/ring-hydroxylating ferredoxin subunit
VAQGNLEVQAVVVGAGIAGLSVAYHLARDHQQVMVIDDGPIGAGETERTTAHLSNALDDRYTRLEKLFGREGARLAAESHGAAIDRIEAIVREHCIECDFERLDGFLFEPPGCSGEDLRAEYDAAQRAGLRVEMVPSPLPFFDTGPAIRFPAQAQFHPMKYLHGLARALAALGGQLYSGVRATAIRDGFPAIVETSSGFRFTAQAVIVATNTPINDTVTMHTKQAPYRTYAVALRIPRDSVPRALFWDTFQKDNHNAYHYVRTQRGQDYDLLIVGGEDHKTGQADDAIERWARLEQWTRQRFPMAQTVEFRWSGQVMEPVDALGFIGRNPGEEHTYIVTGDSGHGMTHGTIAGMLLTDLILGRENPWSKLYNPARVNLKAAGVFASENLNVAAKYGEWFSGGEIRSLEDLPCNSGAVFRDGMNKVAAYRDEQGQVHEYSAICPHLGCVIHWNSVEKTWDCPCHGSRFDCYGEVVNGPANTCLEPVATRTKA